MGPNEGFTPEKDIFGRKPFGDQLTRIVRALENPSVLLLDAQWGTGKTTFVKMWRGELTKAGIPSVYFDAFANDYQQDAFLAVASQIIAEAEDIAPSGKKVLKAFKEKALQAAKALGRASLRLGVRAATAGLIEGEALEKAAADIAKDVGDETTKIIDEVLKERLESHDADREIFENFRTALGKLAAALSSPNDRADSQPGCPLPLIFIIDELDRCRPSFALEILEKIKHFYTVKGVVVLLVSSLSQLESAVHFAYGEIDAHTYLEKFYHLRILFPTGTPGRPDMAAATYLRHIKCNENVANIIEQASHVKPLSLRTLERIGSYCKIVDVSMPKDSIFLPQIIALLCILKVVRPELYEFARKCEITFSQINGLLDIGRWRDKHNPTQRSHQSVRTELLWHFALGELNDQTESAKLQSTLESHNLDASRIIPYYCDLIDGFSFPNT